MIKYQFLTLRRFTLVLKLFFVSIILSLTVQLGYCQPITFERYYDFGTSAAVEQAYCVQATTDGGYIMCGRQNLSKLLLVKVDSAGILEWYKAYSFDGGTWGFAVKQTQDLGYVVAGRSYYNNSYNVIVVRYDQNGDTLWSKRYDPWIATREGNDIEITDSGYTVLINSVYQVDTLYSAQLLFIDTLGNLIAQKVFTKDLGITPCSFKHTDDGGYIIANFTNPSTNDNDVYLIRTDPAGDTLWTKTIGHPAGYSYLLHRSNCINQTADGGYIITGTAINNSLTPQKRILLIRTDEFGDTLWTRQIMGLDDLWGDGGGVPTDDDGYVVAGTNEYDANFYLAKIDGQGTAQWHQSFGGNGDEYVNHLIATPDHGFAICGMEISWGDGGGVYLIKTDSLGNAQSFINGLSNIVASSSSITLYPSPFTEHATVIIKDSQPDGTFTVINTLDEAVKTYAVTTPVFTIHRENLPAGVYIGIYRANDNTISSNIKFIIH